MQTLSRSRGQERTRMSMWAAAFLCALLLLSFSSTAFAAPVSTTPTSTPPTVSAPYAELIDLTTHHLLTAKSTTTETKIASTTKIMTALLVIQSGQLNRQVLIKQSYIDYVIANDASNAGLVVGDRLTVSQLLYAMMLPSGCDAAYALADVLGNGHTSGVANFVAEMNQEAKQLGLTHTYYVNADGLDNPDSHGHYAYSTAADLVKLTSYALSNPLFRQVVGTATYSLPATTTHQAYTWTNTNRLLTTYQGAIGVKTGTTPQAGYCLVFAATRNGHTLLGVVLDSTSNDQRYQDTTALLNWGFSIVA